MRTSHEKLKEQNNAYLNDLNEVKFRMTNIFLTYLK